MGPGGIYEYLAAMHRQDLLREAQQARLADQVTAATVSAWDQALLRIADLVLYAGRRLRAHAARRPLAHTHTVPPCAVAAGGRYHHVHHHTQHHDDALSQRVVWLDV